MRTIAGANAYNAGKMFARYAIAIAIPTTVTPKNAASVNCVLERTGYEEEKNGRIAKNEANHTIKNNPPRV